jgi:hypothetical protein
MTGGHHTVRTFDHTSGHPPALCPLEDELALAWTGTDGRVNLLALRGGNPVAHHIGPVRSLGAPALAALGPWLVLGWTGTDRRVNVARLRRVR